MSEEAFATTPYKGLMPYSEEDAPFFFGRDAEREIITANLMASRLTLLYGPSGVGKSSVLRAGVAHHLRRLARENLDETGSPQFAIVVFNSWRDDPIAGLESRVRESAMQALNGQTVEPVPTSRSLLESFKMWTERLGGELLIILDQFEEYFLYHGKEDGAESFAAQFPRIVNSSDLNVHFLISIRDDGLAKLDRFQGRIPTLFDNRLGIDHLDRSAARAAITQPIEQFNRLYAAGRQRVSIEPELVEAVLDQVKTGEVTVGEAGRGVIKGQTAEAQIETPYLQLVMNRLWEEGVRAGSHTLRLKTLQALGGAQRIVRTHLDAAMKTLPPNEQDVAARVFHYLVTPSGTKIAHTIPDLASYSELPQEKLRPVMERLSGADIRILRGIAPPPDKSDDPRYEIFHDVLAAAILDWRRRHAQEQQRRTQELLEKKRIVRFRIGVVALFVLMVSALVFLTVTKMRENRLADLTRTQEEDLARAKERARLDELALKYNNQPTYEKPVALLVGLTSDNADERSQALENLKQLASNGQLPADLVPVVLETVKTNEPSKEEETRIHIQEAKKANVDVPIPDVPVLRVFIHIRDDQPLQRAKAAQVKRELEDKGMVVPGIERVSNAPLNNELRYFRSDEASEAAGVISSLKDLNIGNTQARYIRGYESSAIIKPHQYELWFGAPKRETPDAGPKDGETEPPGDKEHVSMRIEVVDGETNLSIAGAELNVKSIEKGISFESKVRTNANGVVTLNAIPRIRVSIAVKAKGFYDREVKGDAATLGRDYLPNPSAQARAGRRVFKFELTRQPSAR